VFDSNILPTEITVTFVSPVTVTGKCKVIPLQSRCGPEGGWRYSSTLP